MLFAFAAVIAVLASTFIGRSDVRGDVEQLLLELPAPEGATSSPPHLLNPNDRVLQKQFGSGSIVWTFDEPISSPDDALVVIEGHFLGLGYERLYNGPFKCREASTGNAYYGNEDVIWEVAGFEGRLFASLTWTSDGVRGHEEGGPFKERVLPYKCPE